MSNQMLNAILDPVRCSEKLWLNMSVQYLYGARDFHCQIKVSTRALFTFCISSRLIPIPLCCLHKDVTSMAGAVLSHF